MMLDDKTGNSLGKVHSSVDTTNKTGLWRSLLAFIGPAYLISVGYMDPGNWATDIAAGSAYGYRLIWVLFMSNLMALLLQSLSTRLGIVRGRDLAQASKETYPPLVNFALYILAEIAIAACDLAEVLGLAIGLNLLFHIPLIWGVTIAVLDCFLLLLIIDLGIRRMEAFIVSLVFIMGVSFFIEIFIAKPDVSMLVKGFIPTIPDNLALYLTIGIIGATVMPHNLYLHSALVQTRKINRTGTGLWRAIKYNLIDSIIALNLAFFVNAAILVLAAAVFFKNGLFQVVDILDAHKLLAPLMGTHLAPILFAVALIASGQSSTITGTLAGQIVMEGYLNLRITPWLRRLITRLIAVTPAFITIKLFGDSATGSLLILSQVILSMQLGFAVIPLIYFVSDKKKMGEYAIGPVLKTLSWFCAIIILLLNVKLVADALIPLLEDAQKNNLWLYFTVLPATLFLIMLLLYVIVHPFLQRKEFVNTGMHTDKSLAISSVGKYTRIAIAIDFSEKDSSAVSHAISIGQKDATYCLIHILESPGALLMGENVSDKEKYEDEEKLESYAALLRQKAYKTEVQLGIGNRAKNIAELAGNFNAELLVLGGHGHKGLKDLIFGETINQVRHYTSIPVLAVK